MIARYDIVPDATGWTVRDNVTGLPAVLYGVAQTGLTLEAADDLADALTYIDRQSGRSTHH
jgi:hypothetical protein